MTAILQQAQIIVAQCELIAQQQEAVKELSEELKRVKDLYKHRDDSGLGGVAPLSLRYGQVRSPAILARQSVSYSDLGFD